MKNLNTNFLISGPTKFHLTQINHKTFNWIQSNDTFSNNILNNHYKNNYNINNYARKNK